MKPIDYSKYEGHTPGPLKVCNGKDVFTVSDPRRGADSGFQTADCMMDYAMDGEEEMPYDEQRANARLYADAPDLLAACRERDELLRRALPFVDHVSHHADARQWLTDYSAMTKETT